MEFTFNKYFVFMILVISMIGVSGGIVASIISPYDVETSSQFNIYLNTFDDSTYKDNLEVDASKESDGTFAEYESSFNFGVQAKDTYNETKQFTKATTDLLGLDSQVWYIIFTVVMILISLGVLAYLRGVGRI